MGLNSTDVDLAEVQEQARAWRAAVGTLGAARSASDRTALRRMEGALAGGIAAVRALDEG